MLRYRGKASVCPGRVVSLNDFTTARHVRVDILYVRPSSSHSSSIRARAFAVVASPTLVDPRPRPRARSERRFHRRERHSNARRVAQRRRRPERQVPRISRQRAAQPRAPSSSSSSIRPPRRRRRAPRRPPRRRLRVVVAVVVAVRRPDRPRPVLLLVRARKRARPGVHLLALARRAVVAVAVVARVRAVARARRRRRQPRLRGEEREAIHRVAAVRSRVPGSSRVARGALFVVVPRREVAARATDRRGAGRARRRANRRDRWMRDRPFCRRFMTQGYGCMGKQ